MTKEQIEAAAIEYIDSRRWEQAADIDAAVLEFAIDQVNAALEEAAALEREDIVWEDWPVKIRALKIK